MKDITAIELIEFIEKCKNLMGIQEENLTTNRLRSILQIMIDAGSQQNDENL